VPAQPLRGCVASCDGLLHLSPAVKTQDFSFFNCAAEQFGLDQGSNHPALRLDFNLCPDGLGSGYQDPGYQAPRGWTHDTTKIHCGQRTARYSLARTLLRQESTTTATKILRLLARCTCPLSPSVYPKAVLAVKQRCFSDRADERIMASYGRSSCLFHRVDKVLSALQLKYRYRRKLI
jgi:hypothetical protein